MNTLNIGLFIKTARQKQHLTQKQLADLLTISDKTVSKWERGNGLPDVSLLPKLCEILQIDMDKLLAGDLSSNDCVGGNMKKSNYYVCTTCGNITVCTGGATVACCGNKLEALARNKATDEQKLSVTTIENEWYIQSDHPMRKDNYISFVAFATGDRIELIKLYPEWDVSLRIPKRGRGMLLWYADATGLLYQLL